MSVVSDYSDGVPHVSYCLSTVDGSVLAASGEHTPVYAASTAKLAVLVAALTAVDRDSLDLAQPVEMRSTFPSLIAGAPDFTMVGDEVDRLLPPAGATVELRVVLERMITVSSNEATNMVLDLIGLDAVNAAFTACGATSSWMQRPYGDLAALSAGLTQQVTAADLARLMGAIVGGRAASAASTAFMVDLLERQEYPVIGPAVGARRWGSKSGWVTGIQHDVTFATPSDDLADSIVLAVCTRGYELDAAVATIRAIASLAWQLVGRP